jgi:large subunit ribosomal protein L5
MAKTRLQEKYLSEVAKAMHDKFQYKNVMEIPKIEKVVINMGVGEAVGNSKALESAVADMTQIAGQKPVITKAKKSIAAFKVRQGMPLGAKVTLRGDRMYYFLDKMMNLALPRVRDFRGVSATSFDGRGNYALGLKEQLIFPEINYDKVQKVRGMDVVVVTTANTDAEGRALLSSLGMPFAKTAGGK